ncbi:MAG TPA: bifunctional adenosylcobinamide kinase/adenosylcobinamide-phosphate guanylyltransferase [Polyangia bacterium]
MLAEPGMSRLIVVGGGVRSGKSRFAQGMARRLGKRRAFVATAQALDEEMKARIRRHVEEREGLFVTEEVPLEVPAALGRLYETTDVILVDCLTLWVSNLLTKGAAQSDMTAAYDRLANVLRRRTVPVILVTNEVGLGIVPETPLGRRFRDEVGTLHQILATLADELYVGVMGTILRLRPAPLELATMGGSAPR